MALIKSLDELLDLIPNVSQKGGGELAMPCPFCPTEGERYVENFHGTAFVGEDRMILGRERNGFFCRKCKMNHRGRAGGGFYTFQDFAKAMSHDITEDFAHEISHFEHVERPLFRLWSREKVDVAHERVDRSYWKAFGWTDSTINRFKLGRGTLYTRNPDMHLIPMLGVVRPGESPLSQYYMSSRGTNSNTGEKVKERTPGSAKPYMWLIQDDIESDAIVIVEGEKDAITAWHIGFKNVAVAFGVNHWTKPKSEYLVSLGYKRCFILSDNDEAGRGFARQVSAWSVDAGFKDVRTLNWNEIPSSAGKDITEVHQHFIRKEKSFEVLVNALQAVIMSTAGGVSRARFVEDMDIELPEETLTDLSVIRGEGEDSLFGRSLDFVENYDSRYKRGRGTLLHLRVGPGAGKTHALVKLAERVARASLELKLTERAQLREEIEAFRAEIAEESDPQDRMQLENQLERMEQKLQDFSFQTVGWFGQYKEGFSDLSLVGIDKDLWFNYDARNRENCQNYSLVGLLGANNHDIGTYCHSGCPFRDTCKKSGYLSQDEESKKYPITYYRHQHLRGDYGSKVDNLVVMDEYPGSIWEDTPVRFYINDVYPSMEGWEMDVDDPGVLEAISIFAESVRAAMSKNVGVKARSKDDVANEDYIISGAKFLGLVDAYCQANSGRTLEEIVGCIDSDVLHQFYQPNYISGDILTIRKRCLPYLFDVVARELPDYLADPHNRFPSCIHLVSGQLEVYAAEQVKLSHRTPVIAADASGIPALYQAMFAREVELYEPKFRNPHATVTVVYGSDWTRNQINSEIGIAMKDRRKQLDDKILTLDGEEFDPSTVPVTEELYNSRIVQDALVLIKGLAKRHESLLVVTHKNLKELLESIVAGAYPESIQGDNTPLKLSWGHYGALRGTNAYEKYEAVVLIGAFRIPYDAMWRRIQMWAWLLNIREEIPADTTLADMPYHGQKQGYGYRTFDHWFADRYVNMIEQEEMTQCAERIRPHANNEKKFVYVIASRPALNFVTHLVSKNSLMKEFVRTKENEVEDYIREVWKKKGKMPTYRDISKTYQVSNDTIKPIYKRLEAEFAS